MNKITELVEMIKATGQVKASVQELIAENAKLRLLNLLALSGAPESLYSCAEKAKIGVSLPNDFQGRYFVYADEHELDARLPDCPYQPIKWQPEKIHLCDYESRRGSFALGFSEDGSVVVWKMGRLNL
jgi:hypothetical protein